MFSIYLFNVAGYYVFFQYSFVWSDNKIEQQLNDNSYREDELLEIKVRLDIPYVNEFGYTRVDGEIDIDGIHYKYVKRKVQSDTLFLLCIPHKVKTGLSNSLNKYTEHAVAIPVEGKDNVPSLKKIQHATEYLNYTEYAGIDIALKCTRNYNSRICPFFDAPYIKILNPPPEGICS